MQDGVEQAVALVRDGSAKAAAVEAANRFSGAHRGAAEKTAQAILKLL